MKIRSATEKDISFMMEIINAAKKFFKENGIDQWQNGNPNSDVLLNDIKNGESFVVVDENDSICATAMISMRGEPTYNEIFDGKWINNSQFGVIHRVAVSPSAKKSGLASMLVSYAERQTRAAGFSSLRADTHDDNIPMQKMLEKNGFVYCGNIFLSDGAPRRAYEKML